MVRDVLVREVPAVVRHDFYATAALLGGFVFLGVTHAGGTEPLALIAAVVTTTGLRFAAMYGNLSLPTFGDDPDA